MNYKIINTHVKSPLIEKKVITINGYMRTIDTYGKICTVLL